MIQSIGGDKYSGAKVLCWSRVFVHEKAAGSWRQCSMCFHCRHRLALKLSIRVRYYFLRWLAFGGLFGLYSGRCLKEVLSSRKQREIQQDQRSAAGEEQKWRLVSLHQSHCSFQQCQQNSCQGASFPQNNGGLIHIAAQLAWCPISQGQKRWILQIALQFLQLVFWLHSWQFQLFDATLRSIIFHGK